MSLTCRKCERAGTECICGISPQESVQYELYARTTTEDGRVWTEVLCIGEESQCFAMRKEYIRAIRMAGRVFDNFPDVHDVVNQNGRSTQFVASSLGTPEETHVSFTVEEVA